MLFISEILMFLSNCSILWPVTFLVLQRYQRRSISSCSDQTDHMLDTTKYQTYLSSSVIHLSLKQHDLCQILFLFDHRNFFQVSLARRRRRCRFPANPHPAVCFVLKYDFYFFVVFNIGPVNVSVVPVQHVAHVPWIRRIVV